ncbi:glycosyl hydrolase family 18 protein [Pseudarthrobacter sp. P1]|uniref:glycosyl hydrolase family 18 protein n=1 Tax=Pseudarthrobacter sp. P1 TaxID=3418418 RepID=UPI003CEE4C5C
MACEPSVFRTARRLTAIAGAAAVAAGLLLAAPAGASPGASPGASHPPSHSSSRSGEEDHRVVVYYQTQYNNGSYVSPKALTDHRTGTTDLIVAAIHVNETPGDIRLNDDAPTDAKFTPMWNELGAMQRKGVNVLGMLGGAARGSYARLEPATFDTYYPALKAMIGKYKLDGLDLDVEEQMSLAGVENLIDHLKKDFGKDFIITLAPVAPALYGGGNLSGFSYDELYKSRGASISWFNAQFYCGWGNLATTAGYEKIINHGVVPADKVVAGTYTTTEGCSGYVPMPTLVQTIKSLSGTYKDFGGVASWEYFNSLPGGTAAPWEWAQNTSAAMGAAHHGWGH